MSGEPVNSVEMGNEATVEASVHKDGTRILVTGAGGNLGSACVRALRDRGVEPWKATRRPAADDERELDFTRPDTYSSALAGMERLFLVRPPAIADVKKQIVPFIEAAKTAGVKQIIFVSLLGVQERSYLPHYKIEQAIVASGIPHVFLRPSFFMQNLTTTHREEIRERHELFVPAADGRINFIDCEDIGKVAATVLTQPLDRYAGAWDLTGPASLTFYEIAEALSAELPFAVHYTRPGAIRFVARKVKEGTALGYALVMAMLYVGSRKGAADRVTDGVERITGTPPATIREFISRNRELLQ